MPLFLLKILAAVRKVTSKLLWKIIRRFFLKPPNHPGVWEIVRNYSLLDFNRVMCGKQYKMDPLWGILDYTLYDLDYYFYYEYSYIPSYGGDCDDAAYAWFEYLKNSNLATDIYQILCIDGWKVSTMHFFTVARFHDGYYRLFNYRLFPRPFLSLQETCDVFTKESLVKSGQYKNMRWVIYDSYSNSGDSNA